MPISPIVLDMFSAQRSASRHWVVTGVAGFIGSNLLEALLRLGQKVVGLDNFSTGRRSNLEDVRSAVSAGEWKRFRLVDGDIRDLATCTEAFAGADVILHQAALGSVPRSISDPISTNVSNVDGFLNALVAARESNVQRFVYAASCSTYGDDESLPQVESKIGRPLSPYAVTKYINELYADVFARTYQLPVVGLRYFNVFGPRQDPDGAYAAVVPRWVQALLRGDRCRINGDGETTRDYCYVDNVVQTNLLAASTNDSRALAEVFNVGVGVRSTLNDLYRAIRDRVARVLGDDRVAAMDPEYGPFRAGDVRNSQASIAKARELLQYAPTHDLERGLDAAMPWYVERFGPNAK